MGATLSQSASIERAHAVKLQAEADAVTRTSQADADAAMLRAKADAAKTQAEADAAMLRAQADAARAQAGATRAQAEAVAIRLPVIAAGALGIFLVADFVLHDVKSVQRWRMLRKLRRCEVPKTALAMPVRPLPMESVPLSLSHRPTLLLGPTGCGKSMKLALTARALAQPPASSGLQRCPVVYVRIRQPGGERRAAGSDGAEATAQLAAIAQQVYAQIGFPERSSYFGTMKSMTTRHKVGDMEWDMRTRTTRGRFEEALGLLFEVAEQLHNERLAAGVPIEHASPVLLFDEVQNLIKDSRLASAGGNFIFKQLAVKLLAFGTDRRAVRTAVAGSSALLRYKLEPTAASWPRLECHDMADPPRPVIITALTGMGYTEDEANSMVDLVGPRLRLLERPLEKGAEEVSCSDVLASARGDVQAHLDFTFSGLDAAARRDLARLLEQIFESEAQGAPAPSFLDLSPAMRDMDVSKVLYVRCRYGITFQSQLHRVVWGELRNTPKYVQYRDGHELK
jgi:hypothetical protein